MIDFHSHILPKVDDGSSSVEESLAMLSALKEQGVECVVASSHFIGNITVDDFFKKRNSAYNELMKAIENSDESYPKIILGAEVFVDERLLTNDGIERLCIENTNCIMLEMPAKAWDQLYYQILYTITAKYRLRVMIAHVDRYFSLFGNNKKIFKLAEMQPVFQVNTSDLASYRCKKLLRHLNNLDASVVFGTDCHNMSYRKPYCDVPMKNIEKCFGAQYLNEINCFGKHLLKNNEM